MIATIKAVLYVTWSLLHKIKTRIGDRIAADDRLIDAEICVRCKIRPTGGIATQCEKCLSAYTF